MLRSFSAKSFLETSNGPLLNRSIIDEFNPLLNQDGNEMSLFHCYDSLPERDPSKNQPNRQGWWIHHVFRQFRVMFQTFPQSKTNLRP